MFQNGIIHKFYKIPNDFQMTLREYTIKVGRKRVEKSSYSFEEENPLTVKTEKPVKFVGLAQTTTTLKKKTTPPLEKRATLAKP